MDQSERIRQGAIIIILGIDNLRHTHIIKVVRYYPIQEKRINNMAKKTEIVNQETGEITVVRGVSARAMRPPKSKEVTTISDIAGKNPAAVNLRDHPEFSGMDIYIMDARFSESTLGGKKGSYLVAACYVTASGAEPKEENFLIIMTGSENVQGRVADAMLAAGDGSCFPIKGTLRNSGRAWFLD